ncbi:hypothetical protein EDF52_11370 [Curtobacterium sp. PhB42]|nr:hypothetical protein EDF48_11223 [Curtobacterium sp. PhB191]TDW43116.1 hypothetical protein EDF52_11370 [Curtobacterium sp. PhB42]TDW53586.1 hypothetical protein EDF47_10998 [Curtobacterium sp. PhB190]
MLLVEDLAKSNRLKRSEAPPARISEWDRNMLIEVTKVLGPKEPR